ncbi:SH3 domain-containing protein [Stappia sp. BW2]|nr:SH3 domain-containing protein [Stappia sp. BW2]
MAGGGRTWVTALCDLQEDFAMLRSFRFSAASLAALPVACLLLTGSVQAQDDGFREIRVAPGTAVAANFMDVLMPFLQGHPESDEGNAALDLKVRKAGSGYSVDIVMTGYLDDSLSGEHYRGTVIRTASGQWELLEMKVSPLCARGENVGGVCTASAAPPAMFLSSGDAPDNRLMCVSIARDDVLNVRKGPGTRHAVTGALAAGTCNVELSESCEGSWCEIRSDTISGWVNTRYLEPAN